MIFQDNVIKEYLKNVYFFTGTPCGGKTTMTSDLCAKMEDGNEEHLVWIKADHPKKYYPEFFKMELDNPSKEVKHYVTKAV